MARLSHDEILQLSVAERVQLAEEIWDSIATSPEALPVTDAQKQELDRRLELQSADPNRGTSWPEVRSKLHRPE
jgi:putative addiction module component (TIGR02574 family)